MPKSPETYMHCIQQYRLRRTLLCSLSIVDRFRAMYTDNSVFLQKVLGAGESIA